MGCDCMPTTATYLATGSSHQQQQHEQQPAAATTSAAGSREQQSERWIAKILLKTYIIRIFIRYLILHEINSICPKSEALLSFLSIASMPALAAHLLTIMAAEAAAAAVVALWVGTYKYK